MTTEKHIDISFLASGHINQDILITADNLSGEELIAMLKSGEAFTTIHEDNNVVRLSDWVVLGTVVSTEPELDYEEFQLESDDYELKTDVKKPFDLSRLALAGAIGEYVFEPEMSCDDIIKSLEESGSNNPDLTIESLYQDSRACDILKLIRLDERGLKNIMTLAYDAGKNGQEII